MNAQQTKDFILSNDLLETLLEAIDCHHIRGHDGYVSCANKDGDNPNAIIVYLNENLTTINYTRNMIKGDRTTDIFDLVAFNMDLSFFKAFQFVCDLFDLDYYGSDEEELPESLQLLKMLKEMQVDVDNADTNISLKPIDSRMLSYYLPCGNKMFEDDGISLQTQYDFGLRYDPESNRIIIPLYDELGTLVGIKGRLMKERLESYEQKYLYMFRFNKSKHLYGLYENYELIKSQGYVIVFESEKSVMLAYEHGIGAVSIGGCKISKWQVEMLSRLNVKIIIALDKDRNIEDVQTECNRFIEQILVYYIYDKDNILNEKESPIDSFEKFEVLKKNNTYKFKKEVIA